MNKKTTHKRGRPMWCPPKDIDWSLTNVEIARENGVNLSTVSRHRGLSGHKQCLRKINWSLADWSWCDRAIAERLGCSPGRVWAKRRELGLPWGENGKLHRGTGPWFDHGKINWALSNAENARRLGVTQERIRQLRKEAGLKPSNGWGSRGKLAIYAF